ncbi:type IV secretory system conjugative DNA transfer family protein [Pseudomonadota bacterium]
MARYDNDQNTTPNDGLLVGLHDDTPPVVLAFNRDDQVEPQSPEGIWDDSEGHLMTIAPTGAGKGTGCIIPNLLSYPGSVFVIDPKGENYQVTARHRREMGQEVVLFDPFGVTGPKSNGINFLDLLDKEGPDFQDEATVLANMIHWQRMAKDPFWDNMAVKWITAVMMHVATSAPPALRNIGEVHYLFNQSRREWEFTIKEMLQSKSPLVKKAAASISGTEPKVMASIISTAQAQMEFAGSPSIKAVTNFTTFSLDDFRDGKPMSVYLVMPPDKLFSHRALFRLFVSVLMGQITKRNTKPKVPTLFIMDEAAQLGPMSQFRQAMTLMRGYGLRVWSFWQDLSQLQHLYPTDWETMLNNSAVVQMFGFNNRRMAKGAAYIAGYNKYEEPKEFFGLPRPKQVLLMPGHDPMFTRRPNYLKDPMFEHEFDTNPMHDGISVIDAEPEQGVA